MTTENVTINLEFVGEVSDSQRELLEKLFAGTEAVNEACCGEPEDCVFDKPQQKSIAAQIIEWADEQGLKLEPWQEDYLHKVYADYSAQSAPVGTWWTPDYAKPEGIDVSDHQPEPETCSTPGCDEPVVSDAEFVDFALADLRCFISAVVDNAPSEQVLQYVLEADQALEDAQIHIADQAEKARLQAEEDEVVDEWRIAVMKASNVTKHNFTDWDMMAEDTKRMWRDRFYGNMEWLENFAKGDK